MNTAPDVLVTIGILMCVLFMAEVAVHAITRVGEWLRGPLDPDPQDERSTWRE